MSPIAMQDRWRVLARWVRSPTAPLEHPVPRTWVWLTGRIREIALSVLDREFAFVGQGSSNSGYFSAKWQLAGGLLTELTIGPDRKGRTVA